MKARYRMAYVAIAAAALVALAGCAVPVSGNGIESDDSGSRATAASWPVIQQGETSAEVRALQYLLRERGYSLSADGVFGSGTDAAVRSFQKSKSLDVDGIVGTDTWTALAVTVKSGSSGEAVKAAQYLLNAKYGKSLSVDGAFGAGTLAAVKAFQSAKGLTADGIVGPTTWRYLAAKAATGTDFWSSRAGSWTFPVKESIYDMSGGSRYFGANRDGGARAHAGVDMIPVNGPGTAVYAMTGGTVIAYYYFYEGTYALEVKNTDGTVVRYGEISSPLRAGATVAKGQKIGTIINNTDGTCMLHLEVYKGTASGSLTNSSNTTYSYVARRNYCRRSDLIDPMGVSKLR